MTAENSRKTGRRGSPKAPTPATSSPPENRRKTGGGRADRGRFAPGTSGKQGTGLGERYALTQAGRRPAGELSTLASSIAPVSPLLGLEDAAALARQRENIQSQAALQGFGLDAQERAARAQSVANIFGTAAGATLFGGNRRPIVIS